MKTIISSLAEYENFQFRKGQKFKVVNALFEIKEINGVLWVVDPENYGSEIKQEGCSDSLKGALEMGKTISLVEQ
jgi:hypothetical protein